MITTRFDDNTKFFLTQIDIEHKHPQITNTPLKYEITQDKTVLARFTTQQEMDTALQEIKKDCLITTELNRLTQFFLTQINITTNSVINTRLQYEILQNNTVLARFTTREEMNNAIKQIIKNQPPPPQMILIISQHTKIPVATTGNTKHIDGELHYEIIINNNKHYVNTKLLTETTDTP